MLERVRPLLDVLGKVIARRCQRRRTNDQGLQPDGHGRRHRSGCRRQYGLPDAAGLDPEKVRQALGGGSATSRVLEVFGARMTGRAKFSAGTSRPGCTTRISASCCRRRTGWASPCRWRPVSASSSQRPDGRRHGARRHRLLVACARKSAPERRNVPTRGAGRGSGRCS